MVIQGDCNDIPSTKIAKDIHNKYNQLLVGHRKKELLHLQSASSPELEEPNKEASHSATYN